MGNVSARAPAAGDDDPDVRRPQLVAGVVVADTADLPEWAPVVDSDGDRAATVAIGAWDRRPATRSKSKRLELQSCKALLEKNDELRRAIDSEIDLQESLKRHLDKTEAKLDRLQRQLNRLQGQEMVH